MRANIRTTLSAWLFLLAAGTASCGSTAPGLPDDGLSVLFVGNSLTAANDLPGMVAALAGAAGVERFRYEEVTAGGVGLWRTTGTTAGRSRRSRGPGGTSSCCSRARPRWKAAGST